VEFPGEVGRALDVTEFSEWFDWMRRELPLGGIELPHEETAVSFAGHALQLRDRVRSIYLHLPVPLGDRLVESAIVYQCWKLQRDSRAKSKWPETNRANTLSPVDAVRYIRQVGDGWGYHLVQGGDGFNYIITVPSGFSNETVPATEIVCNRLAKLLGVTVPDARVVIIDAVLLRRGHDTRPGRAHRAPRRSPEFCVGFRQPSTPPAHPSDHEGTALTARNRRDLMGALVFDIWTLNMCARGWAAAFSGITGRTECTLVDDIGGLSGSDWGLFLNSTYQSLPAPQVIGAKVTRWTQLEPWLRRVRELDMNPIWELVFQMPALWYGGDRRGLTSVLDKLSMRQWDLPRAVHHFIQAGYFPAFKMPPSRAEPDINASAQHSRRSAPQAVSALAVSQGSQFRCRRL
jgi:hypothetical protein